MANDRAPAATDALVLLEQANGIALIPLPTPLTRLNYFDGKLLRADDLRTEQDYLRRLVGLANRAGGSGVVHGLDLRLRAGDRLQLAAGLAIDGEGRVLYLPDDAEVALAELLRRSAAPTATGQQATAVTSAGFGACEIAAATPTVAPVQGLDLYVIGIAHAEALCGQETVYGRLCEEACATDTDRPYRLEGVVLRAEPLRLATPLPQSAQAALDQTHLRSRVAAAYFADESQQLGRLISAAGLGSEAWCRGALPAGGSFVPLAVLARAGAATAFLDAWIARRERIDAQPRRYWQWRMRMRPWDVFLAQVLQFQCQLRDLFAAAPGGGAADPCDPLRTLVAEAADAVAELQAHYLATSERLVEAAGREAVREKAGYSRGLSQLKDLAARLDEARRTAGLAPRDRVLIRGGIVELPGAGYLPVVAGAALTVNDQVRALLGEGVDLRFCVVRPDYVPHAFEAAQHLERISLLRGLDDPQSLEAVDILVPDGEIEGAKADRGIGWEMRVRAVPQTDVGRLDLAVEAAAEATKAAADAAARASLTVGLTRPAVASAVERAVMAGAARSARRADGGREFYYAGVVETASQDELVAELADWAKKNRNTAEEAVWAAADLVNRRVGGAATPEVKPRGRARGAKAAAAAAATPQAIAMNLAMLRAEAQSYRARQIEYLATHGSFSGLTHYPGLQSVPEADHAALWIGGRVAADPFVAAEGAQIDAALDLTMLMPRKAASLFLDLALKGRLRVEQRLSARAGQVVKASFVGDAVVHVIFGTLVNERRVLPLDLPVALMARRAGNRGTVAVEIDLAGAMDQKNLFIGASHLELRVQWEDDPERAVMGLVLSSPLAMRKELVAAQAPRTTFAVVGELSRNDDVLEPGHPLRAASETAIDVLATREGSASFAADARADLFAERAPQADALVVRATRDWVLFHRRREQRCGAGEARPRLETRRYQVFHSAVRTDEAARLARAAVLTADAARIARAGFAPVMLAEFAGGRSSLATPLAGLLADWQRASPAGRIRFGAIGSQGAAVAEGEALAKSRLSTLLFALAQEQAASADTQVLPALPPLGLAGLDGAIFVVTQSLPVPVEPTPAALSRVLFIAADSLEGDAIKLGQAAPFAHEFADDRPQDAAALKNAWASQILFDRGAIINRVQVGAHAGLGADYAARIAKAIASVWPLQAGVGAPALDSGVITSAQANAARAKGEDPGQYAAVVLAEVIFLT